MKNKLSSQGITALCGNTAQQVSIRVVAETGSTNADLLAGIDALTTPMLLVAERQTAGRGRAGRVWYSAPGASLTFSLAWKFNLPVQALVGLPLVVGVVIVEALATFGIETRLKWPNDVLYEGKKLAGILIETASTADTPHDTCWAIIGIGLNMRVPDSLATQIDRPVAGIPWLADLDQNLLMATLLNGLSEAMTRFEVDGPAAFLQRWNALHAYAGQAVAIFDNGKAVHEGTAIGVDETGRFLLDTATGRTAVVAGDVSLRKREG